MMLWVGYFLRGTSHFFGKSRLVSWWLKRVGGPVTTRLTDEVRITCDLNIPYEAMVWMGWEEARELEWLNHLIEPGDVFVDVGANIGLWTLMAAHRTGSHGKVIAVEPNLDAYQKLQDNIRLNRFDSQVIALNSAAGAESGDLFLHSSREHNRGTVNTERGVDSIAVPVKTLTELCAGKSVKGIKIDVEGSELEVLQGGAELIRQHRPWIIIEFNIQGLVSNKLGDFPPHQYLRKNGYRALESPLIYEEGLKTVSDDFTTPTYCNLFYQFEGVRL